ncbi:hypothetical protein ON010_g16589 [Phytophthora cinnamomi]|nr:hypothetical protein ON010_g16589 [Phytophthora cinnamomi]
MCCCSPALCARSAAVMGSSQAENRATHVATAPDPPDFAARASPGHSRNSEAQPPFGPAIPSSLSSSLSLLQSQLLHQPSAFSMPARLVQLVIILAAIVFAGKLVQRGSPRSAL